VFANGSRALRIAALVVSAYFLYFAAGAVHAHLAADDPTNLGRYYERGVPRVLFDTVAFWSDAYRPVGGLFYLFTYSLFGLSPLPYRLVLLAVVAANVYLTWRITFRITQSEAAAALAAMLACVHSSQLSIYYDNSFVYDVFAYFFVALMLVLQIERRHPAFVALTFFAAINSKEIAIVGAAWVLAYELFIAKPRRWLVPAVLVAISIPYIAGRMFAPGALGNVNGYQMQFTLHRFVVNCCLYLNDLFHSAYFRPGKRLEIAWILLTLVCGFLSRRTRRRDVWWGWLLVSSVLLPIAFVVVPRTGSGLYSAAIRLVTVPGDCIGDHRRLENAMGGRRAARGDRGRVHYPAIALQNPADSGGSGQDVVSADAVTRPARAAIAPCARHFSI
jgi:hypothetical protein